MAQREIMDAPPVVLAPPVAFAKLAALESELGSAIRGKREVVRLSLVCLLARGHLLIEDVPGVGKTTLAQALARSVDCSFHRLQFTSDMLPSDVLGVTIYNVHSEAFEFKPGPIFTNFLLADEINRTTPKTQSALLEAMNERQVTIDGRSHPLPMPFMVIATQNPVEHHGTYPLPESQLDRFLMRLRIGYPDAASERDIVLPRGAGYETLAGFVLAMLGFIPQGGESFVFEGRRYTVLEVEGRRVVKVRIESMPSTTIVTGPGPEPPGRPV
jgi:MoxR-like ATPase